jgi:hypothetical protein
MKFLHAAAFAVVLTMAGSPALRAQQPDQDKDKPKQQDEEKKKPAPNEKEKPQPKPDARDNKEKPPAEQPTREKAPARQEDRTNRSQQEQTAPRANQDRNDQRNGNANDQRNGNAGERGEQGGNRSAHRIPEDRYRQNFGREHHFRVSRRDDRRVDYGGYSFQYSDEWPSDWSYDDDVYIVLDGDDYYLVDLNHPGIRLRLILVE